MSASIEISMLLDALPNTADKVGNLVNLKILLSNINAGALRDVVPNTSFDVIFECLQSENIEQLSASCDVLSLLLQGLEPPDLLAEFHSELLIGLKHHDEGVREMCLKQIYRAAEHSPQQLAMHTNIVVQTAALIGDPNLPVAKQAEQALITLALATDGLGCVFQQMVVDKLYEVSRTSDITRFRVYAALVHLACQSPDALARCSESGFLQQLFNEVYREDLLTQLNGLELLTELVLTPQGMQSLSEQGVVSRLEELLLTAQTDALASFLLPGLVKFFGNVASMYPKEVCGRFKDFIQLVFELLHGPDVSLATLAAETLGVIGGSLEGKQALEKQGRQMLAATKKMGDLINNAPTEFRVRILDVVSVLIRLKGEMQTTEMLALTEQWFAHLMPRPVQVLLAICSQPFPDLRQHASGTLCKLANLPWGQRLLANEPGFTEYLLDRSTEKTMEGKDCKYNIVKTLAESPTTASIFGAPHLMQFRTYVNDGPYYIRTEALVATEGD